MEFSLKSDTEFTIQYELSSSKLNIAKEKGKMEKAQTLQIH